MTIPEYLDKIPEEEKLDLSRSMFSLLVKRMPAFRKDFAELNVGKEANTIDRLLFLYLLSTLLDKDEHMQLELGTFLIYMRKVSFPLIPSEKYGVAVSPDFKRWAIDDDGQNGMETFRASWSILPEEYTDWIKSTFLNFPNRIPGYEDGDAPSKIA